MTVSTETFKVTYTGNSVTTAFPITFFVQDEAHLQVYEITVATDTAVLLAPSAYTVSGVPGSGTITYAPGGNPITSAKQLMIRREVPLTQPLDILNTGGFHPDSIEDQLDRMVMQAQQLSDGADRAVVTKDGQAKQVLPLPSQGSVIGWHENKLVNVANTMAGAQEYVDDAQEWAEAASGWATDAQTSATAADVSADAAEASKVLAQTAEVSAEAAAADAELARDAAMTAVGIFPDTTAGLAAAAEGEYFFVEPATASGSLTLYRDVAGVAVLKATYPSGDEITEAIERNQAIIEMFPRDEYAVYISANPVAVGGYPVARYANANRVLDHVYLEIVDADGGATLEATIRVEGLVVYGPVTVTYGTPLDDNEASISVYQGEKVTFEINEITGSVRGVWAQTDGPVTDTYFNTLWLFSHGETGFWYDLPDTDKTYQTYTQTTGAGSQPANSAEEPIGVLFDKSTWSGLSFEKFLEAQPELLVNGSFATDLSGWTNASAGTGTAVWEDGHAKFTCTDSSNQGRLTQSVTGVTVWDDLHVVAGDILSATSSTVIGYGNTTSGLNPMIQTAQVGHHIAFQKPSSGTPRIVCTRHGNVAGNSTTDNISWKRVPGRHATQATTANRPLRKTGGFAKFDGTNDSLLVKHTPGATGSILAKVAIPVSTTGRDVIIGGSSTALRCFLCVDSSGRLGGGIGAQDEATIHGTASLRGRRVVVAMTWDGVDVTLYENGAVVYTGAQSGNPIGGDPFRLGASNQGGVAADFFPGDMYQAVTTDDVLTPDEIQKQSIAWGW